MVLFLLKLFVIFGFTLFAIWGGLALFFVVPDPSGLNLLLSALFVASLPGSFLIGRSFFRGCFVYLLTCGVLLVWWNSLTPTNTKEWAPEVSKVSHGTIQGRSLKMYNIRNFQYTTEDEFSIKWETRNYDLEKIEGLDLFLSYWASDHIAHTILSWDFGDGKHLAISIETRKDKNQKYSAIKGFFKEYELIYIAGDESDLIGLRTNFRKERVYAYNLKVPKERARALLENYIQEMNRLVDQPRFYNALTRNCTTTIHLHSKALRPERKYKVDWRLIASGHVDELLYEHGLLNQSIPFAQLREQSRIDKRMQLLEVNDYSVRLRNTK